jgi:hypothetical protein
MRSIVVQMRFALTLAFLLMVGIHPSIRLELDQTASSYVLTEGSYWRYQINQISQAEGTGSYEGKSLIIQSSTGTVTIRNLTATALVLEDQREINLSSHGTGFFKQDRKELVSLSTTSTIDRKTFKITSYKTEGDSTNLEIEDKGMVGKPNIYLVSTTLTEGQQAQYYWEAEAIACSVTFGTTNIGGQALPIYTLQYSGPKKVVIRTVTRFQEEGEAEGTFAFERTTGLLTLYAVKETAKLRGGSCCTVKATNSENYTLLSTSLWTTPVNRPLPTSTPTGTAPAQTTNPKLEGAQGTPAAQYFPSLTVAVVVISSVVASYMVIRRKRKTEE